MHHFFVDSDDIRDGRVYIRGDDFHHAVRVLRVKPGEQLMISDSEGRDFLTKVEEIDRGTCGTGPGGPADREGGEERFAASHNAGREGVLTLSIVEEYAAGHELAAGITLYQCMIKGERMELVIEKAVELGVRRIVPVLSRYSVVRPDPDRLKARTRRLNSKAAAAARQAKRSIVPEVTPPVDFEDALRLMADHDVRLIPYECAGESGTRLGDIVITGAERPGVMRDGDFADNGDLTIGVMIGPEGGFHPEEIALAIRYGVRPVTLGPRILRAETAAIATLSYIMLTLEEGAG